MSVQKALSSLNKGEAMKGFNVFMFALVMAVMFWAVSLEIKTNNQELELKQLKAYVQKLENKVDTDYSIIINKGWE